MRTKTFVKTLSKRQCRYLLHYSGFEVTQGETRGELRFCVEQNLLAGTIARGARRKIFNPDTDEEHRQRHVELHRALHELFADFILHHPHQVGYLKMPLNVLLLWSHEQTQNPTSLKPMKKENERANSKRNGGDGRSRPSSPIKQETPERDRQKSD